MGAYLHEHLPASELVVVDTPGHCAHLTASEETIQEIKHFLELSDALALA